MINALFILNIKERYIKGIISFSEAVQILMDYKLEEEHAIKVLSNKQNA